MINSSMLMEWPCRLPFHSELSASSFLCGMSHIFGFKFLSDVAKRGQLLLSRMLTVKCVLLPSAVQPIIMSNEGVVVSRNAAPQELGRYYIM
jgi:hypothetical protein